MKKKHSSLSILFFMFFFIFFMSCGGGGGGTTPTPEPSPPRPPDPTTWTLIALGDSITYGLNHDNPDEEGYFPKLSRKLGKNIVNLGIPGALTQVIADNLVRNLERYQPTHVLVLIGANDVETYPYDVMHYIHQLQYIVNTIRAYNAIPIVGTLTPFCRDYAEDYYIQNIKDRNAAIHQYIEKDMSVTIADFAATFTCDMMEYHGGHHPNSWGYEVMSQIWYDTLMTNPQQ